MITAERATVSPGLETTARCLLYRLLANGFLYPDRGFFEDVQAGRYRDAVTEVFKGQRGNLDAADGLVASGSYLDFQADYLRLFEVGSGIPPCPLYSGLYRGGRKAVMEELTRFYNYFGLSIERGQGELPDHIATELEFMHFLTFKELAAEAQHEDSTPYLRAQADFLERQLASWLPALEQRLLRLDPPPYYAALACMTNALVHDEARYTRSVAGRPEYAEEVSS
jgi:DMSO reductase family type II enzyme chaperone